MIATTILVVERVTMFTFLNVFDSKPDHPMFDPKRARELLGDLTQGDPLKTLDEVTTWLNSVKGTQGFRPEVRADILMLLDETGSPYYDELLRFYVGEPHLRDFKGRQIWQGLHDFKLAVTEGYALCIEEYRMLEKPAVAFKQKLSVICARLMRVLSERMQLSMMRYITIEQSVWESLCRTYAFSVEMGCVDESLKLDPKQADQTTPHREFLRAVMLHIASPATLSPEQIVACHAMISGFITTFDCKTEADHHCTYLIDLARPSAPRKLEEGVKKVSSMRFLGMDRTVEKIVAMIEHHEQHHIDKEQQAEKGMTSAEKLAILKHLRLYWGRNPPTRNQERARLTSAIQVVHGIGAISQLVTRIEQGSLMNLPNQDAQDKPGAMGLAKDEPIVIEQWRVADISERGLGGEIPKSGSAWVKVGDLCGLLLEGSEIWWVGMIRRLKMGGTGATQVGIEILAKKPLAVVLRDHSKNLGKAFHWDVGIDTVRYHDIPVILLPDSNNSYANATMLMATGSFKTGGVYELLIGEKNPNVKLDQLLERGGDYERASFSMMVV